MFLKRHKNWIYGYWNSGWQLYGVKKHNISTNSQPGRWSSQTLILPQLLSQPRLGSPPHYNSAVTVTGHQSRPPSNFKLHSLSENYAAIMLETAWPVRSDGSCASYPTSSQKCYPSINSLGPALRYSQPSTDTAITRCSQPRPSVFLLLTCCGNGAVSTQA